MSNWLTGVIVLLILVILADGFRRTYNARRNSIHLSPKMKKRAKETEFEVEDAPVESFKTELPNGGARVIGYRDPSDVRLPRKKISAKEMREIRRKEDAAKRVPEQKHLNLNESVPILMESVEHQSPHAKKMAATADARITAHGDERIDPTVSADSLSDQEIFDAETAEHFKHDAHKPYAEAGDEDDSDDYDDSEEYDEDEEDLEDDEPDEELEEPTNEEKSAAVAPEPEEVIIINVMAFKGETFNGNSLLDVILQCGLRFGSMDIFHRYSDTKGEGALLFSMANMVKPGTFDLDVMDEFETPGVSLFMTLPITADSLPSFELMLETANKIAETLDGELKDEQRSAMTRQTIEHCRQRIKDFERKKLFRRPR